MKRSYGHAEVNGCWRMESTLPVSTVIGSLPGTISAHCCATRERMASLRPDDSYSTRRLKRTAGSSACQRHQIGQS